MTDPMTDARPVSIEDIPYYADQAAAGELRKLADSDGEARRPEVEAVMNALMPLGYEPVVICADGSEPCASLDVDGGWLDVTVTFRAETTDD